MKSKYWVVLKEHKKALDVNLNFVYKESTELIKAMENNRFPNIKNLTMKRMERSENEVIQFLNNSCSYKLENLKIDESKLSSLDPSTFNDLI